MADEATIRRVHALFEELLLLPDSERRGRLAKCPEELAAKVERLLRIDATEKTLSSSWERRLPVLPSGGWLGGYRVLEELGAGGMGVVYRAEQAKPIAREVAIKVVRPGLETAEVLARFEAEQRALGLMNHESIATVFEAGVAPNGLPYFVMEYVRGVPITEFCDSRALAVHERLTLFNRVCQAVHHAHQKGIIHRDLKPSNILVSIDSEEPVPKIIDFGIVKALGRIEATGELTRQGQVMGTPGYMSPEQVAHPDDVDVRTDVYALGALLYELLSGFRLFEEEGSSWKSFQRLCEQILKEVPTKPSLRLERAPTDDRLEAARTRQTTPSGLSRLLRGDLDVVVLKALQKQQNRRYDSASSLYVDIENHLAGRPVVARPSTALYVVGRFASRNRRRVVAASAVSLALLVAIAALSVARTNSRESVRLRSEFEDLLLSEVDTSLGRASDWKLPATLLPKDHEEQLDALVEQMLSGSRPPTLARARRLRMIGELYSTDEKAIPVLEESLGISSGLLGPAFPLVVSTQAALAYRYARAGRYPEGAALLETAVATMAAIIPADDRMLSEARVSLAAMLSQIESPDAVRQMESILREQRGLLGPRDPVVLAISRHLAEGQLALGMPDAAGTTVGRVIREVSQVNGETDKQLFLFWTLLVQARGESGDLEGQERAARRHFAIAVQLAEDGVATNSPEMLCSVLGATGKSAEALRLVEAFYKDQLRRLDSLGTGREAGVVVLESALQPLVSLYKGSGRIDEAAHAIATFLQIVDEGASSYLATWSANSAWSDRLTSYLVVLREAGYAEQAATWAVRWDEELVG